MVAQYPQKILMTTDATSGVWVYTLELVRELSQHGIEVAIASMGAPLRPEQRQEVQTIPHVQLFESHFKVEWMAQSWKEVDRAGEWLLDLQDQVNPDLVHLNEYVHGSLPWRSPVVMVGHSCRLSWWQAVKGEAAPSEWQTYGDRVAQGIHQATRLVAPSHALLSALDTYYSPLPPTQVIPNGRSSVRFSPRAKQNIVLAVGRLWDDAKNMAAISQIATDLPCPTYIAGEIQHPDGSTVTLPHVENLGRLPYRVLQAWYGYARILAHPALYEPFGLVPLEAALSGCALVLYDIPSLREIWGEAALFVPPGDPQALKETLLSLIESPTQQRMMADRAYQQAQLYTPQRMARAYLELYAEVLEENQLVVV